MVRFFCAVGYIGLYLSCIAYCSWVARFLSLLYLGVHLGADPSQYQRVDPRPIRVVSACFLDFAFYLPDSVVFRGPNLGRSRQTGRPQRVGTAFACVREDLGFGHNRNLPIYPAPAVQLIALAGMGRVLQGTDVVRWFVGNDIDAVSVRNRQSRRSGVPEVLWPGIQELHGSY